MRLAPKRQTVLLRHGFTESESRVYLALLEHPAMSAGALSKVTTVPRSHLYKVLNDLHARGVVDLLAATGTRMYRARPFADFLRARAAELKERVGEVESEIETLAAAMQPPPLEAPEDEGETAVRVVMGRRAVAREVDALLESASRSVLIGVTEGSTGRLARHAQQHIDAFRERGIVMTVVLPPTRSSSIEWERLVADGVAKHRWLAHGVPALVVIVDDARMIVVHPTPDSEDLRTGKDFAVFVSDAVLVESYSRLVRDASSAREPR